MNPREKRVAWPSERLSLQYRHVSNSVLTSESSRHIRDGFVAEFHADHDIDYKHERREEDGAGHAFAIEHQEECEIDQRGSRLLLADDEYHRQEEQEDDAQEVLIVREVEAVALHEFAHGQCDGKLGEFGWLKLHGAYRNPRAGTLRVRGDEDGEEQHEHHHHIDDHGRLVVEPLLDEQQGAGEQQRCEYPYKLLTGIEAEREQVGMVIVVTGATYGEPAPEQQHDIKPDGPPVERHKDSLVI